MLTLNPLSTKNGLADHMLAAYITHLSLNLGDGELEDEIFGDFGHQLGDLDAVFSLLDFLPLITVNLGYSDASDHTLGDAAHMDNYFIGNQ